MKSILILFAAWLQLVQQSVGDTAVSWPPPPMMEEPSFVHNPSLADSGQWCPPECDCFNYFETVDCSRRGLISMPVFSDVVRRLYLEGDQLEDIPPGSFQFAANLSVIILESNHLKSIDATVFCGLMHLQELDLSSNKIQLFTITALSSPVSVARVATCQAPGLKEINLSHNALTTIPIRLAEFAPNLEILNLAFNEIVSASFDSSYVTMTSLRYLDLSRNDIRRINAKDFDSIRENTALETLSLSDCRLVYIDEGTFHGMNNMTSLTLARSLVNHTVFENAFEAFSSDNSLARLDISETYIMNLTTAMIGRFTRLVALFASYCDLEFVEPELFLLLPYLETLHVEGGQLTRLDNVSSMKKLRRLNAHMNRLTYIDLGGLDCLESVDLSYNQLDLLGSGWIGGGGGTEDIQMLNLSHNKISYIDKNAFNQIIAITTLDLSYNHMTEFPSFGSFKVSKLDMSHNGMHYVPPRSFDTLHQTLNELDLSYNDFTQFPDHSFRDFHFLQFLGFGHNRLGDSLRENAQTGNLFDSLQLLQVLDLSYNDITVLGTAYLPALHHLNTLYLQGNLIRDIQDASVDSSRVLAKLVLSSNRIHSVNVDVLSRLEYLEEIDLSDNPFECTCTLVPFLDWTNSTTVALLTAAGERSTEYRCEFPPSTAGKSIFSERAYPKDCHRSYSAQEGFVVSGEHSRSPGVGGEMAFQVAVATIVVAGVACFGLICYFGQIGRRVKNMRYRWQIRYREVSDIETAIEPKI